MATKWLWIDLRLFVALPVDVGYVLCLGRKGEFALFPLIWEDFSVPVCLCGERRVSRALN